MNKSLISRKLFSVQHRINKRIYGNQINVPYLSGDGFESICDFSAFSPRVNSLNIGDISSAQSIFCTSHNVEKLIQDFGSDINATILVLGNSDRDFYEFNLQLPNSIKSVYLQNSHISNDFYRTLPIGLENLRLARNGIPSLYKSGDISRIKQNKILVGPFSPSHIERKELEKWKNISHEMIVFEENYMGPKKLSKLSADFLFVACPRGNGTDTHRFWETLYRGSIPVVKRSKWSESIKTLNIPFVELSNWDFEEFRDLIKENTFRSIDPGDLPSLWTSYWQKII